MDVYLPGKDQQWGHVHTLSHVLSSVELQCEWICGPENPGPECGVEGRGEQEDKNSFSEACVHCSDTWYITRE